MTNYSVTLMINIVHTILVVNAVIFASNFVLVALVLYNYQYLRISPWIIFNLVIVYQKRDSAIFLPSINGIALSQSNSSVTF